MIHNSRPGCMHFASSGAALDSIRSRRLIGQLSLVCVIFLARHGTVPADVVGYTFYGSNPSPAIPNAIGGGYFLLDPTAAAYSDGGVIRKWNLSGAAAIDNSLADGKPPYYEGGSYVEGLGIPDNGGWLRYDGEAFINIYMNPGPGVSPGDSLGSFLGRGFRDVSGGPAGQPANYTAIATPIISHFTAQDVFSDPKSLQQPVISGGTMNAKFTPYVNIGGSQFPMHVQDVAALFGVDHFNWVQHVTLPASWSVQMQVGSTLFPAPQPIVDPIPNPLANYLITNEAGAKTLVTTGFTPDTFPYYFNEGGGGIAEIADVRNWTSSDQVSFLDTPAFSKAFNPNLQNIVFTTELVGVKSDGSEKDTHIGITWKSNYVTAPIGPPAGGAQFGGFLSNLDTSGLPASLGGGISNVHFFTPEPSTIVLAALGVFALVAYRWRIA